MKRDLADGVDRLVAGPARLVGDDAAALVDLEAGVTRQLVARAHAGGEHDDVDRQLAAVGEAHLADATVASGLDLSGRGRRHDLDAELLR